MDDLLNKTRYNNLIRPATSSAQLISIQLQLSVAQLISLVGAGGGPRGTATPWPSLGERGGHPACRAGSWVTWLFLWHCPDLWTRSQTLHLILLHVHKLVKESEGQH